MRRFWSRLRGRKPIPDIIDSLIEGVDGQEDVLELMDAMGIKVPHGLVRALDGQEDIKAALMLVDNSWMCGIEDHGIFEWQQVRVL